MSEFDDWLAKHRKDWRGVTKELKTAIADFTLIRSFFEARVIAPANESIFQERASQGKDNNITMSMNLERVSKEGVRDFTHDDRFKQAFDYFKTRHIDGHSAAFVTP